MALSHNPKIVTNGLVFYYDMSNTVKSWKGKPTTNLVPNPVFSPTSYSPWSYQTTANGNAALDTSVTYDGHPSVRITRTSTGGESNVWLNLYASHGLQANTQYTFSAWVLANNANEAAIFSYYGTSSNGFQYHSGSGNWERIEHTFTTRSTEPYVQIRMWHDTTTLNSPVWFTKLQVEEGAFASPFTLDARSTTQAILDLSKNNHAITATSLQYNSDNTFEFDGSNNYMTSSGSSDWAFGTDGTVEQWVYPTNATGNDRLWCVNNNPSSLDAYLNGSTYNVYFHGGGVGTTNQLTKDAWNHVCVRYTAGSISVFFNGVEQSLTGTTSGYNITNSGTLLIGEYQNLGGYRFYGKIPIMRVYNISLSNQQIKQNFNAQRHRFGL